MAVEAIIIAEGECDGKIFSFETQGELDAFCKGVSEGAGRYGCGSCSAFSKWDLGDRLVSDDEKEIIRQYLK